jgi:CRISPR-associated protein Cas6
MPVIDVRFPVRGNFIPVDHGYLLFAAISKTLLNFHGDDTVGVHPIAGLLNGNRCQMLTDRSYLTIRLPS